MDITKTLDEFMELLDNKAYFEAHEVLEEAWHKLKKNGDDKSNLARGLINAAVAFEHIKRNTPTASIKANKTYNGYLRYKHLCDDDFNWRKACNKVETIASYHGLLLHPIA